MQAITTSSSLELSLDGDSLSGRAGVENGESRQFSGWLGLAPGVLTIR